MPEHKTPLQKAKQKVFFVFAELSPERDLHWKERLFGGYEVETSLSSCTLHGWVGDDGEYAVGIHWNQYVDGGRNKQSKCLVSGSFAPSPVASHGDRREDAETPMWQKTTQGVANGPNPNSTPLREDEKRVFDAYRKGEETL